MKGLGRDWPGQAVDDAGHSAARLLPVATGFVEWLNKAVPNGIFGLALGLLLITVAQGATAPVQGAVMGLLPGRKAASSEGAGAPGGVRLSVAEVSR